MCNSCPDVVCLLFKSANLGNIISYYLQLVLAYKMLYLIIVSLLYFLCPENCLASRWRYSDMVYSRWSWPHQEHYCLYFRDEWNQQSTWRTVLFHRKRFNWNGKMLLIIFCNVFFFFHAHLRCFHSEFARCTRTGRPGCKICSFFPTPWNNMNCMHISAKWDLIMK